jgi:hypothetical protein
MLTVLHVVFGTVALAAVPLALAVRKGGKWHRIAGIVFTVSMFAVLFSAGFLWQAKGHLFLVPLAAVTAYLIFNAWRVIARRRRKRPDPIDDNVDRLAAIAAIAAAIATAYRGVTANTPLLKSIAPALVGIGGIGICFGLNELIGFTAPRTRPGWQFAHLSAMIASYISATTAFLVINAHHVPMIFRWLVPSSIGAAAIVAFSLNVLRNNWRIERALGKQRAATAGRASKSPSSPVAPATAPGGPAR